MLFSNGSRNYAGPKQYAEPSYHYLNRSARREAEIIRSEIEKWFSHYPKSGRSELLGRFTSPIDLQHTAAAFELYLHELFLKLNYSIAVHPETLSAKATRPDFLLEDTNGSRLYVEAVQGTDISLEEQNAQARLNVVFDAINKMHIKDWFLGISTKNYPETSPSTQKLRQQIKTWLENLDPDVTIETVKREGRDAFPKFEYVDGVWKLEFTAFPRRSKKRSEPHPALGAFFGEARWLSTWQVVRDRLLEKSSRYGVLDAPLVVAVNAAVFHLDKIDVMQALFGEERYLIRPDDPHHEPEMQRARNGFWWGPKGPKNTDIPGVMIGANLNPWTYGAHTLICYQNPWTNRDMNGPIMTLSRRAPIGGQMDLVAGRHPKEILGLPSGYPGL